MEKQYLKQLNIEQLLDWVWIDEKLLGERTRVINAIPECPEHGRQCVEHALEWIEEVQAQRDKLLKACKMAHALLDGIGCAYEAQGETPVMEYLIAAINAGEKADE